ncbi:exopolysaccharide production repressor protein [Mesorhizobium loti]|uniref:exopolysaccharide production repressor protein n=1 Tax=Rhizobium loti TaxID=381 RepID=UPI00244C66B7|nr:MULTISPECIES: exopolysaccharide production repressor protein [Mesorhizobium]
MCANAATVYFASHSIGRAIVITLASSLLLQLAYFASVLSLVWLRQLLECGSLSVRSIHWVCRRLT